jgi:hypothetical protein
VTDADLAPGLLSTPAGSVECSEPAPGVLVVVARGHLEASLVPPVLAWRDRAVARLGSIDIFDDGVDLKSYDSEARVLLTAWGKRNRDKVREHHILFRSRVVAMGISVANLALGGHIQTHTSRAAYEAALAAAVLRRKR